MRVLGVTSDDKVAQLETLVRTILGRQSYQKVRLNVVGAGGNELDVEAVLETLLLGDTQVTPVLGEAKAYMTPVDMPTWQKFLGKVFIERATNPTAVGMLVALNGINGNVVGSYEALHERDKSLFVFEGSDLVRLATDPTHGLVSCQSQVATPIPSARKAAIDSSELVVPPQSKTAPIVGALSRRKDAHPDRGIWALGRRCSVGDLHINLVEPGYRELPSARYVPNPADRSLGSAGKQTR